MATGRVRSVETKNETIFAELGKFRFVKKQNNIRCDRTDPVANSLTTANKHTIVNIEMFQQNNSWSKWFVVFRLPLAVLLLGSLALPFINAKRFLSGLTATSHRAARVVDFGVVAPTYSFKIDLPITNNNRNMLKITDFQMSCTCVSVSPTRLNIPAGETAKVLLTIDLMKDIDLTKPYTTSIPRDVSLIASTEEGQTIGFEVKGRVAPRIRLIPPRLNFGRVEKNAVLPTQEVEVLPSEPSQLIELLGANGKFDIQQVNRGDSRILMITPSANLPSGHHEFVLSVVNRRFDGTTNEAPLSVELDILKEVYTEPDLKVLGAFPINSEINEKFIVRSDPKLSIKKIVVEQNRNLADYVISETSQNTWMIESKIKINNPGNYKFAINIVVEYTSERSFNTSIVKLSVPVHYFGVQKQ